MRSVTAPAALAVALASSPRVLDGQPARLLSRPPVAGLLALGAAGEAVADKMPGAPDRTAPFVLAGRIAMGALVGAAVAGRRHDGLVGAALVGAASAVASSHAMLAVRKAAAECLGALSAGVAEDALAVALGASLARRVV